MNVFRSPLSTARRRPHRAHDFGVRIGRGSSVGAGCARSSEPTRGSSSGARSPSALYPDSSEWAIRLYERDGGTVIEQTFRVLKVPKVMSVVYGLMIPAHRDRSDALTQDLRRLGSLAVGRQSSVLRSP